MVCVILKTGVLPADFIFNGPITVASMVIAEPEKYRTDPTFHPRVRGDDDVVYVNPPRLSAPAVTHASTFFSGISITK